MKTLSVKNSILLMVAATFTFLLLTGCEKEMDTLFSNDQAEMSPNLPLRDETQNSSLPDEPLKPQKITGDLGYEELKTVTVMGVFTGNPRLVGMEKTVVEFEINQIISHPSLLTKPILKAPAHKVKNRMLNSVKCNFELEFLAGTFPWKITGALLLKPGEIVDLGTLPGFYGMITDGIFSAKITELVLYDELDGTISSEK